MSETMIRAYTRLPAATYTDLQSLADRLESTAGAQIRRAVKLMLSDPGCSTGPRFDRSEWAWERQWDDYPVWVWRPRGQRGGARAYQIVSGPHSLWVLPDTHTTGKLRSGVLRRYLAQCEGLDVDYLSYVAGGLLRAGATNLAWEEGP